ncbi:MAG TPA: IS1634 family transposase, partial [Isosphaeraceae bacterium]|nr:IS1634 family transposase [Isosphaeraceae bacterium]
EAVITDFGAVVALYDLAQQLKLSDYIDRHVPKAGSGPSVGTYLLLAAINRCVAPCSKVQMARWFEGTALRRLLDVRPQQLTSQRFWDHMARVSPQAVERIERDLTDHLVRHFDLDVRRVPFDATNFFTFIDTFNHRCTLAQRGKSKEGRAALRIVGLALLVTADFHIPLCHHTYPGNQPDAPTVAGLTAALIDRHRRIAGQVESVTLILDKGNCSTDNLQALEDSPYHFISSLVPTSHPDLLKIPARQFRSLEEEGLPGVRAYRTTKEVFGIERTVVVTYNEASFVAQSRTLLREIAKRQHQLSELQARLLRHQKGEVRGGKRPTMAGVRKTIDGWLKARHMKELFEIDLREHEGLPVLTYRFRTAAWRNLQRTLLGKTILFTDQANWSAAEIVRGYRSQHQVESAFRCLKSPHHVSLRPQRHWTDQKIQVHVFYCVLALLLCSLLRRELHRQGIDRSIPALLEELSQIREVGILTPSQSEGEPRRLEMTRSRLTEEQRRLYDALDLERYAAP